jgi:protoporphyrinogen oxidase
MRTNRQLSRRKLLSAAGAVLPAAACGKLSRNIPGELRGPAVSIGHALRDGAERLRYEQAASEAPESYGIVIAGGGASGLSAAWRLEQLGFRDFVLCELEPRAGGTSVGGRDGVVPYPWGAHYVPVPAAQNPGLLRLLAEMGGVEGGPDGAILGRERELIREPETRVFASGTWYEGLLPIELASPAERKELQSFQKKLEELVAFRDARGRRAFALPMWASSQDERITALDRISAATWLEQQGFRSELVRFYAEYACRDDYGAALERTSAWAMLFYFCARVPDAGQESAPYLSWPEGNARIIEHLQQRSAPRVRTHCMVTDVRSTEHEVELALLDTRQQRLTRARARAVIMATPSFVNARVVRGLRTELARELEFAAWWVANLHLRERPGSRGMPLSWDNVLYDSPSVGYVAATHQALRDHGPTIWTYYRPLWEDEPRAARQKLLALDHAAAVTEVLEDLERAHNDLRRCIERIDVWRWGHAMVVPQPGFLASAARKGLTEPLGRVFFAHSELSGIALFEEAQARGVAAAEAALRTLGRELESLYPEAAS